LNKNNPELQKFNKLISATKIELKGMKTTNAFNTSTINGLKRYKRELIDQRDAVAKTDKAFASYNRRIEATNKRLKRLSSTGISQVGKSFQGLRLRMDKVNTTFSKAPFASVTPKIGRFTNALGQSRTSLSRFSKSSGTANFAVLGLSQGLQDLPFGFIGIQNNIPMVIRSFSQLRQKAGSTSGAFKELGSALLGSGGLFLGTSLLISGITLLTQKYGSLGNAYDELFGNISDAERLQKKLNKALEESLETTSSAISTITSLKTMRECANYGFVDGSVILKKFNDKLGDKVGYANDLNEAESILARNADRFVKFTLKKAVAQKVLNAASKAQTEIFKTQRTK